MDKLLHDAYVSILKEEPVPAMGCTEPIALAYGAAQQGPPGVPRWAGFFLSVAC